MNSEKFHGHYCWVGGQGFPSLGAQGQARARVIFPRLFHSIYILRENCISLSQKLSMAVVPWWDFLFNSCLFAGVLFVLFLHRSCVRCLNLCEFLCQLLCYVKGDAAALQWSPPLAFTPFLPPLPQWSLSLERIKYWVCMVHWELSILVW